MRSCFLLWVVLLYAYAPAAAQYFGQNKPRYERHAWRTIETEHFHIYHYLDNEQRLDDLAAWSEHWYDYHQHVLRDTFTAHNPMIVYHDHPDFQQTYAVSSTIGIGTGGVTEALRNRVIFPLLLSNQQTHQVLGHELVHAFQYHLILQGDSTSMRHLGNLPLWMVEGLAEYMSIGRFDSHTTLWMRDAVMHDKFPSLKDLNDYSTYFPYRYGQAFWAFLTGIHGDTIIRPFFVETAKHGLDSACLIVLGMDKEQLSELWQKSMKAYFGAFLKTPREAHIGKRLFSEKNAGEMNLSPVMSPNGRYVIFLSEKDLFSIDLFLADARTGKIIRKVASSRRDGHLDDLNYIESAGTWSPDSRQFAFVGVKKGNSVLVIKDVESGRTVDEFSLEGVPYFTNPAWSPDGKHIALSGIANGWTDLFVVRISDRRVSRLTHDRYSEVHPAWSPDGNYLVYATDRLSLERGRTRGRWTFNIEMLEVATGTTQTFDFFFGANNLNPVFDNEGQILFLSNRDGYRNLYRFDPATGRILQLTDFTLGITGITEFSPALSTAMDARRLRVVFTLYEDGKYTIWRTRPEDWLNRPVRPDEVDMQAAFLPRLNQLAPNLVDYQLSLLDYYEASHPPRWKPIPYQPRFRLSYMGASVGLGVGQTTGLGTTTGGAGGVDMLFTDILGNHQLMSTLSLNGEIYDFSGMATWLNLKHRLGWGVGLSHIAYPTGRLAFAGFDTLNFGGGLYVPAEHWQFDVIRTFEDKISIFAQYPFSRTLRLEGSLTAAAYYNRVDRFDNYYDAFGRLIYQQRNKLEPATAGYNLFKGRLATASAAFVGDNAAFGITSPLSGHRFRIGFERYFGDFNFNNLVVDLRQYGWFKPIALAARLMHYSRSGRDQYLFYPYYIGYPWYVRGYSYNRANELLPLNGRSSDELLGTKFVVGNFELRLPFTGPRRLCLIPSKVLLTELVLFADGGVAFFQYSDFSLGPDHPQYPDPVFSTGASLRVNVFGALVLEPFYAVPLLQQTRGVWGINIVPGW